MRAVEFNLKDPAFGAELVEVDEPELPNGEWARVAVTVGGIGTPGMSIGFTVGLGGGWADQVLGHRSMLHAIPDAVPDSIASLHEPVSVAVHGLLRQPPRDGDRVLIVGAGIIGLAAVAAVRGLFPACEGTVTARHEHQADAAPAAGAHPAVRAL